MQNMFLIYLAFFFSCKQSTHSILNVVILCKMGDW